MINNISSRIRYLALPVLVELIGAGFVTTVAPAIASAAGPPTLRVQTNAQIEALHSAQIRVEIRRGAPSSSYSVTVQVAGPSGAGGPFCETTGV